MNLALSEFLVWVKRQQRLIIFWGKHTILSYRALFLNRNNNDHIQETHAGIFVR